MHFHLVYIHGFQGDHTTFQGFPTDLQTHLQATIPQSSGITVQTSIYPTYKSVKPISYAAKNFLEWLATQPPGPVILLGHSMGGLLAADAAMDSKNNPSGYPGTKPNRIVGVIAFDTPYLGMHPHVVISGIASLFPDHENNKDTKSEKELNNKEKVKMVDERVTDDWDAFKQRYEDNLQAGSASQSQLSSHSTLSIPPSPTPTPSITSSPSPAPPSPIPSPQPNRSFFAKAQTFLATHSNDPIVRWARKHADDPYGASKRWVTERFQFGSCMFDPSGLKDRYAKLVAWNGLWCNYWTETLVKKESDHEQDREREQKDEGVEPVEPGAEGGQLEIEEDDHERKPEDKKKEKKSKDKEKKKKKPKSGRHFVVLPNGLGDLLGGMQKWDKVTIAGVEDEVAAHCGLFIKNQNLEYEGLVERVGQRVIDWCEQVKARG